MIFKRVFTVGAVPPRDYRILIKSGLNFVFIISIILRCSKGLGNFIAKWHWTKLIDLHYITVEKIKIQ